MTASQISFLFVGVFLVLDAQLTSAIEQEWLFDSPRVYGRGRTFVAANDSDHSSKFNPATLGEADVTFQWRIIDIEGVFIGENTIDTFSDLLSAANSSDGVAVLRKFDENFGKKQYFKAQGSFSSLRFGPVDISAFGVNRSWLEFRVPPLPEVAWSVDTIYGANISYGLQIFNSLSVGLTLRPMSRNYIAGNIGFVDIIEFINPDQVKFEDYASVLEGSGTGADLGLVGHLSPGLRWGFTIRNIGDTAFSTKKNAGDQTIPPLRQTMSLGLMHRSQLGSKFNLDQYLDIHSLLNRDGLNLMRLVNFGAELGSSFFSRDHDYGLVAGFNEGYFAAGLFVDLFFLRLEAINYAVESGHGPGQEQDRRWGLSARSTITI